MALGIALSVSLAQGTTRGGSAWRWPASAFGCSPPAVHPVATLYAQQSPSYRGLIPPADGRAG
jgi:hypothetical protein